MGKTAIILLVGEQPAPNLLPTRWLEPDVAVLVHTDRTARVAGNLKALLDCDYHVYLCEVPPYNILGCQQKMESFLADNLLGYDLVFNLTGGTKLMALAALNIVRACDSRFVYFRTEGNCSRLYHYKLDDHEVRQEKVEDLTAAITLDDYLRMYVGTYETGGPRNEFESRVQEVLQMEPQLEVLWSVRPQDLVALEIDFVVRLGNQVGVGEVKTRGAKSGIDQINAVTDQRYLGTYVRKFLVSGKQVDRNNKNLAKAYSIEVIELSSFTKSGMLSAEDKQRLVQAVITGLGRTSSQNPA